MPARRPRAPTAAAPSSQLDAVSADLLKVVATASGPIVMLDGDLRCVYANGAAPDMAAGDAGALEGRPMVEWLGEDQFGAALMKIAGEVAREGREQRHALCRGSRWYSVHAAMVGAHIVLRLVDITARQAEHEALLASERRYRTLFEVSPLPTFIWDVDTLRFVDVNQAAVDAYGWTREEFLRGLGLPDIRPPSQVGHFLERLDRIRSRQAGRGYYLHRRKDGAEFAVEVVAHRFDLDGRSLRVATARDMTGERHSEAMRSQLAAIVQASNDGVISQDLEGCIRSWNAAAEQIYGWSAQEIIGRPATDLVPSEHVEEYLRERTRVLQLGESFHGVVARRHKNGQRIDIALSLAPIRDDSGAVIGMAGIARDITQQRLLERQLQQAQKMDAVGRLAGGVAHDFNNMLTVIKAHTELMRDDLPPGSDARAGLEEISKASQRAAALTRQLLAFSRQQMLAPTVVDLNEIVVEVQRMLERLIGEDVDITLRLQPTPAQLLADRAQLEQVLVNLAINARDAMPDGGEMTIATSEIELSAADAERYPATAPGRYVVLGVVDTGTGMDEATRARIFEPFFTTKERGKGTGLGLSMVLGVVEQSGGFVTVDSGLGRGTSFRVHLPAVPAPGQHPATLDDARVATGAAGTVLLVEDDAAVRAITRTMLHRQGYAVLEATNGRDALEVVDQHLALLDLVITDAAMPQMSGTELARELEARAPRLPVLYMSGYTDDEVLRSGKLGPLAAFLGKPFTSQQLYHVVGDLIARGHQGRD